MRTILVALVGLLLAAAGCGNHMDHGDMQEQMAAGRAEITRHHDAVLAAQTLDEVRADVAVHDQMMTDMMTDMHGEMDEMSHHCSGDGMDAAHDGMDGMMTEMTDHRMGMEGALTVEDARTLCAEHVAAMEAMMDSVEHGMDMAGCM